MTLSPARITRADEILERQTVLSSPMLCARFDVRDLVTALSAYAGARGVLTSTPGKDTLTLQ